VFTGFITKNWKPIAAIVGIGIARRVLQQRKSIDLQGKVVLITGGSRGLGLALAEEFAQEGAKLVICSREEDELIRASGHLSEFEAEVLAIPCDVTNPEQVQHLVEQATERFGGIDILVNDAGVICMGPWQTLTRSDFEEAMNSMFWGTYNTTMAVLPQMVARKSGRIVNITSIGGKVSVPHLLSYSSAKFAAVGFSEGLHAELAKDGIIVVTVAPGLMRTGSHINAYMKGKRHREEYTLFSLIDTLPLSSISVKRAAKQIVNATRRGDTELIITVQAQLLARLHGAFPGLIIDIMSIVDRFLPSGEGAGTGRYTGKESETSITQSFLTTLGKLASRRYNENSHTAPS
jgi:NAD(P)-dependent dehydrogenase (short-subunit alcohol dehydrogenase family)